MLHLEQIQNNKKFGTDLRTTNGKGVLICPQIIFHLPNVLAINFDGSVGLKSAQDIIHLDSDLLIFFHVTHISGVVEDGKHLPTKMIQIVTKVVQQRPELGYGQDLAVDFEDGSSIQSLDHVGISREARYFLLGDEGRGGVSGALGGNWGEGGYCSLSSDFLKIVAECLGFSKLVLFVQTRRNRNLQANFTTVFFF